MNWLTQLQSRRKHTTNRLKSSLKHIGLGVLLVAVTLTAISYTRAGAPTRVYAAAPSNLNFQARLLTASGAIVPDGNYNVEFKLYDSAGANPSGQGVCSLDSSTDDCWWVETRTGANVVAVKGGYLTVNLGSVTAFGSNVPWDKELWLSMNIGGTGVPVWDGEMLSAASERLKLTAAPYAFHSAQADALTITGGSVTGDNLAQLAPAGLQSLSSANTALRINQTGAGGLLQLQGDGLDVLTVSKAGDITTAEGITLGQSTLTNAGTLRWSGTDFEGYDGSQWVSLTAGTGGPGGTVNQKTTVKTANETLANNATLQNDDELQFSIGANETWAFRFVVQGNSSAQADFKFAVTAPSGATCTVGAVDGEGAVAVGNLGCGVSTGTIAGTGTDEVYEIMGSVTNGSTVGNVTLQWAQDASNAANTTVYAGSYVVATATTSGGGLEFVQGGNAFGGTAVLGTTDNNGLSFITNGLSRMTIASTGAVATAGTFTAGTGLTVTTGGANITGNSTITGTLSGLTGLTVASGGASVTGGLTLVSGGLNLNSNGATNAGAISGITSLTGSGAVSLSSGGSADLTLSPSSGTLVLDASTLRRIAAGTTTLQLNDTSDTTLSILNTDGGAVANLLVEGAVTADSFSGNGSSLTLLSAGNISSGTLADGRLSSNVALLDANQTYSGDATYTGHPTFSTGLIIGNTALTDAGTLRWTGADFEGYTGTEWKSLTGGGAGGGGSTGVVSVIKSADQVINNSATLTNDSELKFTVEASEEWTFRFVLQANSPTTPDLQFAVTAPSGATCDINVLDTEGSTAVSNLGCGTSSGVIASNGTDDTYEIVGTVRNGTTAGTVQLQWAQNVATAVDTTVYEGSYLNAIPVVGGSATPNNAFVQNGNTFGSTAILGTVDANELRFITNGQNRFSIAAGGDVSISNGLSLGGNFTGTGALSITSGGAGDLTLGSGSGLLALTSGTTSLKRTAAGAFTIDLADGAATTLTLSNSGAGVADLNINDGSLQIAGTSVLSNGRLLSNLTGISSSGTISFTSLSAGGLVKADGAGNLSLAAAGTDYEAGLTFENGLTRTGNTIKLGGNLTGSTDIGLNGNTLTITGSGSSVFSAFASGGIEVKADSSAALAVKSASGTSFFTVNTSGSLVQIGSNTTDATAILSVLDSYNNATDPTGVNGASYYNTATNSSRCYANGYWADCSTTRVQSDVTLSGAASSINLTLSGTSTSLSCHLNQTGRSTNSIVYLRFNNVSTAGSYSYNVIQNLTGANNNTSAQSSGSATEIRLTGSSSTTSPGTANINISNFSATNKSVTWTASGSDVSGSVPNTFGGAGTFFNTSSQITSVQFVTSAGNFNSGSRAWCDAR